VTAGFLHSGLLHIGFNMYILYWLGTMLEPSLGHARFLALYLASLLAGSFGALLVSPNAVTVGASGAVFGLMGAAFVMQRARGMDPMQSGIGPVILFNLVLSFVIPNISIGGHIGGLVGGAAAAFAMERLAGRRPGIAAPIAACVAVGAIAVVAAIAVSGRNSPFTG
jgi:membrane associated rhomboid family serine protease